MIFQDRVLQNLTEAALPHGFQSLIQAVQSGAVPPKDVRIKFLWEFLRQRQLLNRSPWLKAALQRIWGQGLSVRQSPGTAQRLIRHLSKMIDTVTTDGRRSRRHSAFAANTHRGGAAVGHPTGSTGNHKTGNCTTMKGKSKPYPSRTSTIGSAGQSKVLNQEARHGSALYLKFNGFVPSRLIRVTHPRVIPPVVVELGKLVGLIYRSDKGCPGRPQTYIHFMENPPRLVCNSEGTQLYVVGGNYRVTRRGIEG